MEAEARTVEAMVHLACRLRHHHHPTCPECTDLLVYTLQRLNRCAQAPDKPACAACRTHCYAPARQAAIRQVMRTAGPWMALYHPWLAVRHLLKL